MTSRLQWTVAASAAAVLLFGCGATREEEDGPPKPLAVTFEGKRDSQFEGVWRTKDGRSGLILEKDGSASINSIVPTPSGDKKESLSASWLSNSGNLLLKYGKSGQAETVLKYRATFSGTEMTLEQPGGHLKTVYSKK